MQRGLVAILAVRPSMMGKMMRDLTALFGNKRLSTGRAYTPTLQATFNVSNASYLSIFQCIN